jgi:hypothetical protein
MNGIICLDAFNVFLLPLCETIDSNGNTCPKLSMQNAFLNEILGSHDNDYQDDCFLECDAYY